ncbi:MAG: aldo/keto reductase [Candidatus Nanopelagicales bacterium]|nr:aldo/keto reductase [Candidatus Nanopelagicales bacterium]MDZ4250081.1 aldo/keto reductase [Candidatus Nanopelagicales bacterium]
MEQRQLGNTGMRVSRIGLGTMTWGRDTDEHEARDQWKAFLHAGGNFIDTADVYADGSSEEMIGQLLHETGGRDRIVIGTKAVSRPKTSRRFDASRRHLLASLDGSLARLGVDYVDIWNLHAWDPHTPLDETLAAADDAVRSGRVRYVGVSNYAGWQIAQAATWQRAVPGRYAPAVAQMEYSLVQRGIEREVAPACEALGLGITPWSPLGRGVLTGKYRYGKPADSRAASSHFGPFVAEHLDDRAARIVDAVCTAAEGLDVAPLEVALAWVRDRPGVAAPIVGARTIGQLRTILESERLELPSEIRTALDEVSAPHRGYPEYGWNQDNRS